MSRPVHPGGAGTGQELAWAIPAAGAVLLVASAATWAGGTLAALLTGPTTQHTGPHDGSPSRFSLLFVVQVARDGTGSRWPAVSPILIWSLTAVLLLLVAGPLTFGVMRWLTRRPAADDPRRSLARPSDVAHLTLPQVAAGAARLRPSLAGREPHQVPAGDVGLALGRLASSAARGAAGGRVLFSSWEDVVLAYMAPRSGKSTALAIPAVLSAPGAVIATSNKADVWAATAAIRQAETSERVWTFDPQHIAYAPQTWWWDPLSDLVSVEEAERLAGHFVLTVEDDHNRDIWGPAAQELLAALMLAARSCGGTLHDVYSWLNDEANPVPVETLREAGYRGLAASLAGTQGSPAETRGSVYFTARVAAKCLRNPDITAWITPPTQSFVSGPDGTSVAIEQFHPADLPRSRQTLYLLSKDGGGSAAPLVAALTDRVMRAATLAAEQAGGRLDPPLVVVLDEAANICRIADLPQLYSHLGSRGVIPLTILQSHAQGVSVWGQTGMQALLGAATVKIVGSGIDDASFAEDLSRLIGDHDVTTITLNTGDGRHSRSRSVRQQRILPAAAIRALPKGQALVWLTGSKVALVHTLPWYTGPRATDIAAQIQTAEARLTANAQGINKPDPSRQDAATAATAATGGRW